MTQVDELIRAALNDEDAKWFDELEEQTMPDLLAESFRGQHRWFVIAVYGVITVLAVLMVLSAVRFLGADQVSAQIRWGIGFLFSLTTIGLLKIWYWGELNRLALTREIKRFELQLARLSHRLEGEA